MWAAADGGEEGIVHRFKTKAMSLVGHSNNSNTQLSPLYKPVSGPEVPSFIAVIGFEIYCVVKFPRLTV